MKIAGKTQAIAAFHYAKQKVKHLLDKDVGTGRGVNYRAADESGMPCQDELEGVALTTQIRLAEKKSYLGDDFDMHFVRSVLDFCQTEYALRLTAAPEIHVAPPIFLAADGNTHPKSVIMETIIVPVADHESIESENESATDCTNPEKSTVPIVAAIEKLEKLGERLEERLDKPFLITCGRHLKSAACGI